MMLWRACTMLKSVESGKPWLGRHPRSLSSFLWSCRSMVSYRLLIIACFTSHGGCSPNCSVYIGEFEYVDGHKAGKIVVELNGWMVDWTTVVSSVLALMLEWRKLRDGRPGCFHLVRSVAYNSNLQFGYIVLTTSAGIMDHEEARRKNVGGKVLGFY